ncbi:MAG TPA: hypothetical protein VJ827_10270 [Rubrobacter sp.]|nr:hypothetical protein [Rubrobacter sp.]
MTFGLFAAAIPGYVSNVLKLGQAGWMGAPVEGPAGFVFVFDLLGVLASVTASVVCLTLAVVLFWQRSDEWMVVFVSSYLLLYGTTLAGPLEWAEDFYPGWPSLAVDFVQPLLLTTPTIALTILFPDGRLVPRWTRWLILLSIPSVGAVLYLPLSYWSVPMSMILIGAIYAQIYRYRVVSTPTERQQTKWVLSGFALWWVLMVVLFVPYSLESNLPAHSPLPWWTLVNSAGWWLALTIVPLSLSIAVLRYRLYDIDVVINRTLVYGSLTLMLGVVYFGSVASLQYAFRALTGHEEQPQLAIVVSTLVIAALFNPLRRRIQSFIDRRFYRRKYDAAKTLETFSSKLRDETDLGTLSKELVSAVRETMQPEHVSLWLRSDVASRSRRSGW